MSYSIGLSGLRSTNEQLNVISQNIANVNTSGFKSGRAEFSSVYSGGSAGGVEVAAISSNFDRDGDVVNTGRSMDLAISGRGFFVLNNGGETSYTRAGSFVRNASNYIETSSGARLQGYPVDANGALLSGVISDLKVGTGTLPAKASSSVEFAANLKADAAAPATAFDPTNIQPDMYNYSQSGKVFDSLGREHVLTQYFVKQVPGPAVTAVAAKPAVIADPTATPKVIGSPEVKAVAARGITVENEWDVHYFIDGQKAGTTATQTLNFDTSGNITSPTGSVELSQTITGADPLSIKISMTNMSQNAASFSLSRNETNGYGAGDLKTIRIDDDGSLYGVYTNGQDKLQGKVILANFANPNGLRQGDNTTWGQSFASGAPTVGLPSSGTLGSLTSGAYEGSNVDLTGELVSLMTAQRNYQANSKTISAAEKMTQVLFNAF
ncbi:flagellar hook protein [Moritella sp. PE36]|uniref:flagellar hook protein FlgE n=1 Tax=Moritella sp. PE36 TaxID=58051 RepID=UPI000156815C|nr:flagellar hook protein FlgE [Moritella sp. PE36]EDM68240.1 flagellar hook protein [Moritella sp. PE36]